MNKPGHPDRGNIENTAETSPSIPEKEGKNSARWHGAAWGSLRQSGAAWGSVGQHGAGGQAAWASMAQQGGSMGSGRVRGEQGGAGPRHVRGSG